MQKKTSVSDASPAVSYLEQIGDRIAAMRAESSHFTDLGQSMAKPLLDGGNLFVASIAPYFPHEFCHRAGGIMGVRYFRKGLQTRQDVGYFALPDPRHWKADDDAKFKDLLASPARLFVNGRDDELPQGMRKRIAGFTGGASAHDGQYAFKKLRPLTNFRSFEQMVRGWITAGEMIAACIRGGKMPILWMSAWLEGAMVRNAYFTNHDNILEPWSASLFHDRRYIPPLDAGYASGAFLDELTKIHARLSAQAGILAQAGKWMAQAHRAGRGVHIVAVGHSYPEILELSHTPNFPIQWGSSMSDLNKAVPATIGKGEVAIHLGYSPVNVEDVRRIVDRGVKFIYTTPFGRPDALKDHPNLLWFDLPWRPTDATVDIPGYSVRMLPMSSSCHAMTYNAILSEFAQQMGWK